MLWGYGPGAAGVVGMAHACPHCRGMLTCASSDNILLKGLEALVTRLPRKLVLAVCRAGVMTSSRCNFVRLSDCLISYIPRNIHLYF